MTMKTAIMLLLLVGIVTATMPIQLMLTGTLIPPPPKFPQFSRPVPGAPDTGVSACGNLNTANEYYYLSADLSSTDTCLNISADNITLNGNGHKITSTGGVNAIAVNVNARNATVSNITIANFTIGINLTANAIGSKISRNNLTYNCSIYVAYAYGIYSTAPNASILHNMIRNYTGCIGADGGNGTDGAPGSPGGGIGEDGGNGTNGSDGSVGGPGTSIISIYAHLGTDPATIHNNTISNLTGGIGGRGGDGGAGGAGGEGGPCADEVTGGTGGTGGAGGKAGAGGSGGLVAGIDYLSTATGDILDNIIADLFGGDSGEAGDGGLGGTGGAGGTCTGPGTLTGGDGGTGGKGGNGQQSMPGGSARGIFLMDGSQYVQVSQNLVQNLTGGDPGASSTTGSGGAGGVGGAPGEGSNGAGGTGGKGGDAEDAIAGGLPSCGICLRPVGYHNVSSNNVSNVTSSGAISAPMGGSGGAGGDGGGSGVQQGPGGNGGDGGNGAATIAALDSLLIDVFDSAYNNIINNILKRSNPIWGNAGSAGGPGGAGGAGNPMGGMGAPGIGHEGETAANGKADCVRFNSISSSNNFLVGNNLTCYYWFDNQDSTNSNLFNASKCRLTNGSKGNIYYTNISDPFDYLQVAGIWTVSELIDTDYDWYAEAGSGRPINSTAWWHWSGYGNDSHPYAGSQTPINTNMTINSSCNYTCENQVINMGKGGIYYNGTGTLSFLNCTINASAFERQAGDTGGFTTIWVNRSSNITLITPP